MNEIKEKLDNLHSKILRSPFAKNVTESEIIALIESKKAVEKQIPKKPRFYAHDYYCSECGNLVGNDEFEWQRFLYCDKCQSTGTDRSVWRRHTENQCGYVHR